jgi:hypothetical protein
VINKKNQGFTPEVVYPKTINQLGQQNSYDIISNLVFPVNFFSINTTNHEAIPK